MKNVNLAITFILFYTFSNAQSLAVNTDGSTANASSILDVKSTAKGVLIPRMSKAEKNAIAVPANGLLVYQNAPDSVGFHYYNGVEWLYLLNHKTDSLSWKTNGNYITGNKFIGTLNDSAFKIRVNNQPSGIVDSINQNTSIGFGTLRNLKSTGFPNGMFNTAIGYKALDSTTFGSFNNAFGGFALHNNTIGYYNTAIGSYSQFNNKKGNFNSAFGNEAMLSNIMGSGNVALGYGSLYHSDSASNNVAIGQRSLSHFNDVGNTDNIAIGSQSMFNLNTGIWNSIVGADAMYYANNSSLNSGIGFRTLKSIIEGGDNNTLGVGTMEYKDTALSCVAIGRFALSGHETNNNLPDTGSIAIGTGAGRYNNVSYNTFIGYESGIGSAGVAGMTGKEIVSIGAFSLNKLSTGSSNSTFGYAALFNNTTGNKNIAVGSKSLYGNQTGNYNVGIGDSALYFNSSLSSIATQGLGNIGIGSKSMWTNIYGSNNIALGREALVGNSDGDNNIGIGYRVGSSITNGSNNIFIGNSAGGLLNVSNKLFIENSNADKDNALIYGDFAADSLNLNAIVNIRDYTRLGTQASGAPAIKMKKITGTNGAAGTLTSFTHGLTQAKILSVSIYINATSGNDISPRSTYIGYEYDSYVSPTAVAIRNVSGNDANIAGRPIRILITYEE